MSLPNARVQGQYEILEKIGEGGMGSVYKVRHRLLHDLRVIKTLRPHLVRDETLRRRFEKEARWAIRLQHPNIARLYDYAVDDDGAAFIVLELINGLTLEAILDRGERPSVGLALELGRQALRALAHLHRHRVVHRDISPDNLMLGRDVDGLPELKLIDLGLAKTLEGGEDLTQSGHFVGKLRYAAPELLAESSESRVGPWTDLYAMSLVLYQLLTGRFPVRGQGASSLIAGHLFRAPIPFSESDPEGRVPDALRDAVLRGLAKDPEERYPDAKSMLEHLEDLGIPYDPRAPETTELLDRILSESAPRARGRDEGSTQSRIDRRFVAETVREVAGNATVDTIPLDPGAIERAQQKAKIAEAIRNVEGDISRGDLASARARVDEAYGEAPQNEELRELAERVEEIARVAFRDQVQELIREARENAEAHDFDAALASLESARDLLPGDRQVLRLLEEVHRQEENHRAAQDRHRAMDARAVEIETAVDRGHLREARQLLDEAAEAFREETHWRVLGGRLEGIEAAARQSEVGRRMARARHLLESEATGDALVELDAVLRLDPTHGEAERVRARLVGDPQASSDPFIEVRQLLDEERFDEARVKLDRLQKSPTHREEATSLSRHLTQLQRQVQTELLLAEEVGALLREGAGAHRTKPAAVDGDQAERRADALVEKARHRAGLEDWDSARELVAQARELKPDHTSALRLEERLAAMEKARERETREREAFDAALAQIRVDLSSGRASDAGRKLELAAKRFGDRTELRDLRWKAVETRLDADSSLEAVQNLSETVVQRVVQRSSVDSVAMSVAQIEAFRRTGNLEEARRALQRARARFGNVPSLYRMARVLDRAMAQPPGTAPRARAATQAPPPVRPMQRSKARSSRLPWILLAILVIAGSALLGVWQGKRNTRQPVPGEVAFSLESPEGSGRIAAIVDADGWEVAIPTDARELPISLGLPPGTYVLHLDLVRGEVTEERELDFEVLADHRLRLVFDANGELVRDDLEVLDVPPDAPP